MIHDPFITIDSAITFFVCEVQIEGFYPGVTGATGLAETIYGLSNRFSKLPYTLLGEAFTAESVMKDMSMTDPPGRGYRYYRGKNTIVPFGFGATEIDDR